MKIQRLLLSLLPALPLFLAEAQPEKAPAPSHQPIAAAAVDLSEPSGSPRKLARQFLELHRRSAYGDRQASAQLASWKRQGVGGPELYVNAAKIEKLALERDHPQLWGRLGMAYFRGQGGLQQDAQRGIELLRQASERGDDQSTLDLGYLYSDSDFNPHTPLDVGKAKGYFGQLAEKGSPEGLFGLGLVARFHDADRQGAARYFEQAGDAGLNDGYLLAGIARYAPDAKPQERRRAVELLEKAAPKSQKAALLAGLAHLAGENGPPRDLGKAAEYLSLASEGPDIRIAQELEASLSAADSPDDSPQRRETRRLYRQGLQQLSSRSASHPKAAQLLERLGGKAAQARAAQ